MVGTVPCMEITKVNKSNDLFSCGLNNNIVRKVGRKVTTTEN